MPDIVYLDVCCFKRPFDDATQPRIRREAEAVAGLLDAAQEDRVRLVRSPAHTFENERNPREDRRLATRLWLAAAVIELTAGPSTVARELGGWGFDPLDALHVAFAEQAEARWFATTDDRLLKRARIQGERLRVQVVGPESIPVEKSSERGESI